MIKSIATFIAGIIFCVIVSSTIFFYWSTHKMTKVHTLEYPMLLSGDSSANSYHMLPKGTTLYYDQSYDEGFTRYKVYINIDRMPLNLVTLQDPTTIIPIWAYAPDKNDMKSLLREYPLTKSDLQSILKSGQLSKEDVKEILADFISKN
jgi:hypothetical protein